MQDWLRYSCQMNLPGFDEQTQHKLQDAKVLIIGAGGLGCPAAQYLAAIGIGTLGIADGDIVSVKNLHRQILYTPADEGQKKVHVIGKRLAEQNPGINIVLHDTFISTSNVMSIISAYDIIVDCTDNFDTRYLLNDACVLAGKPLVYGAIYQYEGQVAIWNIPTGNGNRSPNYRDLFPEVNAASVPDCADGGVIPTIAGIIGLIQANEVIKYITGTGEVLAGKLLVIDALTMQNRVMKIGGITRTNITDLPEVVTISEITVQELRSSVHNFELVDVRTAEERDEFNIGGKHIPVSDIEETIIETTKPIVFYCATGKRSATAIQILQPRYPELKMYSLKGGLGAWPGVKHQG